MHQLSELNDPVKSHEIVPFSQGCGSGLDPDSIGSVDPDPDSESGPDPGGQKLPIKVEFFFFKFMF
jgi:hypothetical protein